MAGSAVAAPPSAAERETARRLMDTGRTETQGGNLMNALDAYKKAHPGRDWPWYFGGDDPTIMDLLRIRTIPAFFLLNGNSIAQAPAPPPSNGMAAVLHRIRTQADEENRSRPDQGPPPRR